MEWLASLRKSIDYMEEHLLTDIGAREVADAVHISPLLFFTSDACDDLSGWVA